MRLTLRLVLILAAVAVPFAAPRAQAPAGAVTVESPWVRAVPGQSASGAFMTIRAAQPVKLIGVATPVAGVVEIHEMSMDGGVMRMKAVPAGIAIAAGQSVDLKPGGYHVMLMDLKKTLAAGDTVPLTLTFQDAAGKSFAVPVAAKASLAAPAAAHSH